MTRRLPLLCVLAFGCTDTRSDPEGGSGGDGGMGGSTGGAAGTANAGGTSGAVGGTGGAVGGASGTTSVGGSVGSTGGVGGGDGGVAGTPASGGAAGTPASGGVAGTGAAGASTGGGGAGEAGGHSGGTGSGGSMGSAGGGSSVFPPSVTKPRVMIVGDSISAGPGCYKKYLVQQLMTNGITNYEFVGEYTDDCGGGVRHSAVSCTTAANYTRPTFTVPGCFQGRTFKGMAELVAAHDPDLIMLQLGVNDVWGGTAPVAPILANYATLVDQARGHNPNVVVMVAQIHKIITDNCTNMASTAKAQELVMAVPAWARGVSTVQSPVLVADLWTNSNAREANDCVHPNELGAQHMGQNWFNALKTILK